jgi:MFS family permease
MNIIDRWLGKSGTFNRLAVLLFLIEWVRGAFLIAFLPSYAVTRLGFNLSVIGVAVSVHYLMDTIFKGFAGYLLDRYSARLILNGGFILATMGIGLMMFTHVEWVLLVASGLLGIGFSPIWLVCLSQVKEENRASQMGLLYVYWLAGLGLGPVVLNFIMDLGDNAAMFLVIGVFVLGWLVIGKADISVSKASIRNVPIRLQCMRMWSKMKKAGFLVPGMLLQTTAAGMLVPFLTVYAVNHLGLSRSELSIVMMIGGAFAVLAMIPMGKLYDSFGGKWFLVIGFAVFGGALYRLTYTRTWMEAMVLASLMGLAYAVLLPSWNALLARYVPEDAQGTGWGIFSSLEGAGVVVGPLLGSWLASRGDISLPFWTSAALFGLISLVYLFTPSFKFERRETNKGGESSPCLSD